MSQESAFFSDNFDKIELEEFDHVGGEHLQINNQIGKSKYAAVFSALDRHTGREVAIKVIECSAEGNEAWRRAASRIQREVNAWVAVEKISPNILPLYDVICHRVVTPYNKFIVFIIVMQLAPLGDLKKYLREKCPNGLDLPITRLRTFLFNIAEALEAVHTSGQIHKDIKSSNVLVFEGRLENDGRNSLTPKLADFGIAESVIDESHGIEGTAEYMAPEAFVSGGQKYKPDFSTDIYSLGVLFFEIITGHPPYISPVATSSERFSAYETLHKSGNVNYSSLQAKAGPELTSLIKAMLSVEPKNRPEIRSVVTEIQKQIVEALHGEFTAQGTQSIPSSIYRWNPFVHERLGNKLIYYFLKGQNAVNDPKWFCDTLFKNKIHGFSLYRVIGGIDMILRIWERPNVTAKIEEVFHDFKRLHGKWMTFKIEGFHSISSKPAFSFARLEDVHICESIFKNLDENREEENKKLSAANLTLGRVAFDPTKETHPLRVFAAFRIEDRTANLAHKRIFAREIYEAILPFQEAKKIANISVYWGSEAYDFLVKMRLKKFEDYESIWDQCLASFNSVTDGVVVQSDTYLELNRVSFHESDDGNIWDDVDKYRLENRYKWPGKGT